MPEFVEALRQRLRHQLRCGEGAFLCGNCMRQYEEDNSAEPKCFYSHCEYTHFQQPSMGLYIKLWQRLINSETLQSTGAGSAYIEAAGLSVEHIDILCELDDELAEYRKEKNRKR